MVLITPVPGHSLPLTFDIAAIFCFNLLRSLGTHSPIARTVFLISIIILLSALLPMYVVNTI